MKPRAPVLGALLVLALAAPAAAQQDQPLRADGNGIPALGTAVSLSLDGAPLRDALVEVSAAADLPLAFNSDLPDLRRPTSLHADTLTAAVAFLQLLQGTGLEIRVFPSGQLVLVQSRPAPLASTATGSLRLRIMDRQTGGPLPGARVALSELSRLSISDSTGSVSMSRIPEGKYRLEVEMWGYVPVSAVLDFPPGADAEGEIRMDLQPVQVEGVTVTADRVRYSSRLDRNGFYERRRRGFGRLMDRPTIEEMRPVLLSDVFRRVPGIGVVSAGLGESTLIGGRGVFCPMRVFLDGVLWGGSIDEISVTAVEGVEVYSGASQVPAMYSSTIIGCGVVLIWTA